MVVVVEVVAILNFGLALSAAETAWANSIPGTRARERERARLVIVADIFHNTKIVDRLEVIKMRSIVGEERLRDRSMRYVTLPTIARTTIRARAYMRVLIKYSPIPDRPRSTGWPRSAARDYYIEDSISSQRPLRIRGLRKSRRSVGGCKTYDEIHSVRTRTISVAIFSRRANAFSWVIVLKRIKAVVDVYRSFPFHVSFSMIYTVQRYQLSRVMCDNDKFNNTQRYHFSSRTISPLCHHFSLSLS